MIRSNPPNKQAFKDTFFSMQSPPENTKLEHWLKIITTHLTCSENTTTLAGSHPHHYPLLLVLRSSPTKLTRFFHNVKHYMQWLSAIVEMLRYAKWGRHGLLMQRWSMPRNWRTRTRCSWTRFGCNDNNPLWSLHHAFVYLSPLVVTLCLPPHLYHLSYQHHLKLSLLDKFAS